MSAHNPVVSWRAPGRVNVIGEHTDYNGGYVLPIALPLGVTATVTPTADGNVQVSSSAEDAPVGFGVTGLHPGDVEGWAAYPAGVVWALGERGASVPGARIEVDGDVPAGAGLSSSAALECAVATALNDAFELGLDVDDLIAVARRAENDFVGVPTGSLDQSASMLCAEGSALLLDCRSGEHRQVPFDLSAAELVLLVIDTSAPHRLVDGEYAARRHDCETASRELGVDALRDVAATDLDAALARLTSERLRRRVRHVVTENARVLATVTLLEQGLDAPVLGGLLTASHTSLRDDYEVSSRELDLAVDAALDAGAHGARMTGGGFGGSAIALVDEASADAVGDAVRDVFAAARLTAPRVFPAVPSRGAHRL